MDLATPPERGWQSTSRWVILLVVISAITWRARVVFAGGIDVVVIGKALVALVALAAAWAARRSVRDPQPMGTMYLWLLAGYVTVSLFGAWTYGQLSVSAVLSVRVVVLAATIALLVKTFPPERLIRDLFVALTLVALVASVTGLPVLLAGERLRGGIPELHSNELSLLCALPVIGLLFLVVHGWARVGHIVLLILLLGLVWLTGSRTSLLAIAIAFVVILVQARRFNPWLVVVISAALPIGVYLSFQTDVIDEFVNRGGTGRIETLNSRSIVWEAAFSFPQTEWTRWFGVGLATKRIPVTGQYWDDQNLDSSWVSTLVQAGILGIVILVVWLVTLSVRTFFLPRTPRSLIQAVLIFLIIRSVLESGLIDSSPAFVTLLVISLVVDRRPIGTAPLSRRSPGAESRSAAPASRRSSPAAAGPPRPRPD